MRETFGYSLAVLAVLLAFGGIWAARYYSPRRKYVRMRARERRAARKRSKIGEADIHRSQRTAACEPTMNLDSRATYAEAPGFMQVDRLKAEAIGKLI